MVEIAGFIAALTEYGCMGTHLLIVPAIAIEKWANELHKWLPFMNIGIVNPADTESVDVVIKSAVKGYLTDHCRPDYKDTDILFEDTNQISNERCWQARRYVTN